MTFNDTIATAEARAANKAGKLTTGKNVPYDVVRRLDVAEVAKLIRKKLRADYPKWKFSVRSERFSMGTAIRVEYTQDFGLFNDIADFNHMLRGFEYNRFDGMTDSGSSISSWLSPTGVMVPAYCAAFGTNPEEDNPNPGGWELVSSGAKYVTSQRSW